MRCENARCVFQKRTWRDIITGFCATKRILKNIPTESFWAAKLSATMLINFTSSPNEIRASSGISFGRGMDYLGEVGIGSWEYESYAKTFRPLNGWISAGSGRIDLTGKQLAEALYTRVAFGLDTIRMAVVPADDYKKPHSPSAWKMSNAIESWAWNGCEGKKTKVEVYARAVSSSCS